LITQKHLLFIAKPKQTGQSDYSGISENEIYPVIQRTDIIFNQKRVKLFKVMKFNNERYVGQEFADGDDRFKDSWKKKIDYNKQSIYGTTDDMNIYFSFVEVLEFANNRQLTRVPERISNPEPITLNSHRSKHFKVEADNDEARIEFVDKSVDNTENRVRFLVGKIDQRSRRITYVRHEISKKKSDFVYLGQGKLIVLIDSQKERSFDLRNCLLTRPLLQKKLDGRAGRVQTR
jgi:hypothetical protein